MAKVMMVACEPLTLGNLVCFLLTFLERPSHRAALGSLAGSNAWRECVAKVGQSEGGGLMDSSGPGLLSQLNFFLEISFPAWRQSIVSKTGWTSFISVDPEPSIMPGT